MTGRGRERARVRGKADGERMVRTRIARAHIHARTTHTIHTRRAHTTRVVSFYPSESFSTQPGLAQRPAQSHAPRTREREEREARPVSFFLLLCPPLTQRRRECWPHRSRSWLSVALPIARAPRKRQVRTDGRRRVMPPRARLARVPTQQRQRPDTLFPLRLIVPLLALFFLPFELSLPLSLSLSLSRCLSLFLFLRRP